MVLRPQKLLKPVLWKIGAVSEALHLKGGHQEDPGAAPHSPASALPNQGSQGEGIRGVWQRIWLSGRTVLFLFGHLPSKAPLAGCTARAGLLIHTQETLPARVLQIALLWHSAPLRRANKTWENFTRGISTKTTL